MMRDKRLDKQKIDIDQEILNKTEKSKLFIKEKKIQRKIIMINEIFERTRDKVIHQSLSGPMIKNRRSFHKRNPEKKRYQLIKSGSSFSEIKGSNDEDSQQIPRNLTKFELESKLPEVISEK